MISRQAPDAPVLAEEPRPPKQRKPIAVWVIGGAGRLLAIVRAGRRLVPGKLTEVQKNDNAAYLPVDSRVDQGRQGVGAIPDRAISARIHRLPTRQWADRRRQDEDRRGRADLQVASRASLPTRWRRRATRRRTTRPPASRSRWSARQGDVSVQGDDLVKVEKDVIKAAKADAPEGLVMHSAGPGGLLVAFIDSFSGIDGTLLMAAGFVVILILLVVYRSPVLWFFPILSAVLALGSASLIIYLLAKHDVITLERAEPGHPVRSGARRRHGLRATAGQPLSRGVAQVREPARRDDRAAWRGAAPPIVASGVTVILGLLCLSFGELNSDREPGPGVRDRDRLHAVRDADLSSGVASSCGRWIFWPRVPHWITRPTSPRTGSGDASPQGRPPRPAVLDLATLSWSAARSGSPGCKADGLSTIDRFTNNPEAVQSVRRSTTRSFDQGAGAPAVIIANADKADAGDRRGVQGVRESRRPQARCASQPDYAKLAKPPAARASWAGLPARRRCR